MLRETDDLLPESSDYAGPPEKKKRISTFLKWGIWFPSLDWLFVAVGDLDDSNNNQETEIYNQINKMMICCSSTKHLYCAYQPVKLFSFHNSSLFPEQP